MARHRSYSIAFKRQFVQEYALGWSIDARLTTAALRAALEEGVWRQD